MAYAPPRKFLERLFGDKPQGTYINIWSLPSKRSGFFETPSAAAANVKELVKAKSDIYFGLGLSPKIYKPNYRVLANSVAGITCLWADLDFASSAAHKKKGLPPSEAACHEILSDLPRPTIIVQSGYGLHAYWRLKEPWIFSGPDDRKSAQDLCRRWGSSVKAAARKRGYVLDSVHDISRVFRVPGTQNYKDIDKPRLVKIIEFDETGQYDYGLNDFDETIENLGEISELRAERATAKDSLGLKLKADAQPPLNKFLAMCEAEPKFHKSFERTRKDMEDNSASAYDFSLASFAVQSGWEDQEICDLLIASRSKHEDNLKLRENYYAITILNARRTTTVDNLDVMLEELEHTAATPEEFRSGAFAEISKSFGVTVTSIVKYKASEPIYHLETEKGSIMLGDINNLIEQGRLRNKVAAAADVIIPPFKPKKWRTISQKMLDLLTHKEVGSEATHDGQAFAWIESYLSEKPPTPNLNEAIEMHFPYTKDKSIYVFGPEFRRWVQSVYGERMSAKLMGAILRGFGCEPGEVAVMVGGRPSTRAVWMLPKSFDKHMNVSID